MVYAAASLTLIAASLAEPPRTTRYRIETRMEQVVDLSGMGQSEQRNNLGMVNFLTITLNDTAGGQTVRAVLDSIVGSDTSAALPQASLDSAKGRTWHALLSPEGKLTNVKRMDSSSTGQASELLSSFFPHVKVGAKVGDRWTDTSETTTDAEGQSITTRTITNYSVTGTETRSGARALKIETAFSMAQTGEITQGGQALSVDGTGSGNATYFVAPDGRYLGGSSVTNADLQISAAQFPAPIPVQVKNTVTVTTLP
jgi:hypothetical protein